MTIYDLKPAFQNLLRPVVNTLYRLKITPNQITILTCFLSVLFSYGLYLNIQSNIWLISVSFFLFIRMALNAIDGVLAKSFNLTSKLGAILNEITDVIADTTFFLAFLVHPSFNPPLLLLFSFCSLITEMTGLSALHINSPRRFDGPLGKSDRAFIFGLIALILAFYEIPYNVMNYILGLLIVLSIFTIFNRIQKAINFNETEPKK